MINEPIKVPLVVVRPGDFVQFPIYRFLDVDREPINMSSWVYTASWKQNNHSTQEVELSVVTDDAADGYLTVYADTEASAEIKTSGYWTLVASNNDSIVKTILIGKTRPARA